MQLLSCEIALGGDDRTIVVRDAVNPITYPEALVLMSIHGRENVRELRVVADEDVDKDAERDRLSRIYGEKVVAHTFPGHHVPLPDGDPRLLRKQRLRQTQAPAEPDTPAGAAA